MAAYFLCLTAEGGVPLFSRIYGDLKVLPFAVIGSLNGVHMFGNTHGVELLTTSTRDSKVVWKSYHDSITLIVVGQDDNSSDAHLLRLLDTVFNAMVLVYGQDELINIKNIERFKREIKVCYALVDRLLEGVKSSSFAELTLAVDVIVGPENGILQTYLNAFVEAAESSYGCLMVQGKVAVMTRKWSELTATESVLLAYLLNSLPNCTSRDIAVFLPDSSPTVPHRLLTFQLVQGVEVCVICGPSPPLPVLQREVERFWRSSVDSLKLMTRLHTRNFPTGVSIDPNILGFLLVNNSCHRCLSSVSLHGEEHWSTGRSITSQKVRAILRCFYKTIMGKVFQHPSVNNSSRDVSSQDLCSRLCHQPTDTYICTDTHKCYALSQGAYQLFIVFSPAVPTYAMRSVSDKTLKAMLKDKQMQGHL